MDKNIAACGNNCKVCPRHMPKTDSELKATAELWYKIGYRDKVVSNEEIQCFGCTTNNWCRYKIVGCVLEHEVDNCGECPHYSCEKIEKAFEQTMLFEPNCKLQCNLDEYNIMKEAFFEKRKNLDRIKLKSNHPVSCKKCMDIYPE